MGQYWKPVNLDKKEFLDPHKLGCGLKLMEQASIFPGTGTALLLLLASSNKRRGGGDPDDGHAVVGRWAGDRIVMIGQYAEDGDFPVREGELGASKIYEDLKYSYKDISDEVCAVLEHEIGGKFVGDDWRDFVFNS